MEKELETVKESTYSLMRKMAVNEKIVIPIEHWQLVRSYAYTLKKKMDRRYKVNRMCTDTTRTDFLLVVRTQ